ncbi:MAG: PAS domain S-box protein, partial [Pseudomonadota bacterium]
MAERPTYEELEQRVLELEKGNFKRKQAEESLQLTQFVFNKATIGIYHISSDGRILNVNEQVTKSLGYTKDELSNMTISDIDPTLCHQNLESLWQTLCRNKWNRIETVHKHKEGKIFPVEVITNLFEYNGKKFSISFVQDITERKLADKKR